MIVVLLEMLLGACLLVCPFFSRRAQLPHPLAPPLCDNVSDRDDPGREKQKHKGVLCAFSFLPEYERVPTNVKMKLGFIFF